MKKIIFIFIIISLIFPQKVYAQGINYGILPQNNISTKNISKFENCLGKHEIYAFKYNENNVLSQILSCKIKHKTPFIIFEEETDFKKAAEIIAKSEMKCFVEIVPLTIKCKYTQKEYISVFQGASAYFKKYAPKAVVVYSFSAENLSKAVDYFPNKYYADKIGLIYYAPQNADMLTAYITIKNACEKFSSMPIMLSRFGASHFSVETECYTENETAEFIKSFYSLINKEFPKIEGIIYSDLYISEKMPDGTYVNNYRITEPSGLAEKYKNIVDEYIK